MLRYCYTLLSYLIQPLILFFMEAAGISGAFSRALWFLWQCNPAISERGSYSCCFGRGSDCRDPFN